MSSVEQRNLRRMNLGSANGSYGRLNGEVCREEEERGGRVGCRDAGVGSVWYVGGAGRRGIDEEWQCGYDCSGRRSTG
jgi:hypothetical protein